MDILGILSGNIVLVVIIAIVGYVIVIYNRLIALKITADGAWSQIDVALKKRYDLIDNLVETVKGYASHEKETLTEVIEARNKATEVNIDMKNVTPAQMAQFSSAQSGLSGALSKLFALAEQYPDLKANQNFLEFQKEIALIEDEILSYRTQFNNKVGDYNRERAMFPANIIASLFNFTERDFFELDSEEEREAPKVSFSDEE